MSNTTILFGSTTGNTESLASSIAEALGVSADEVHSVDGYDLSELENYDLILMGSSTWGAGDLQDDWESVIDDLKSAPLAGKRVAVFGTGDSSCYPDTFCNSLMAIAAAAQEAGATLIGNEVDASGYEFDESESVVDGKFVGLAIDEDNESDLTEKRISDWVEQLKVSMQ